MNDHTLPSDWMIRPTIDLEMKHYILLGYLQRIQRRFAETKLYPYLDEVELRLKELVDLKRSKAALSVDPKGELKGFDPRTGKPIHANMEQSGTLDMIDELIGIALPRLKGALLQGTDLRDELTTSIRFWPLGIQVLNPTEGWLLLRQGREARVYSYCMPLLRESEEQFQYRSVVTRYRGSSPISISHTYEQLRSALLKEEPSKPLASTFVLESDLDLPYIETFMPLAKRLVYEHIAGTV